MQVTVNKIQSEHKKKRSDDSSIDLTALALQEPVAVFLLHIPVLISRYVWFVNELSR